MGSREFRPFFLPSSLGSHFSNIAADCCDGSDEYDGYIHCPNICVMGGNSEYGNGNYNAKISDVSSFAARETKNGVKVEESLHNLTGNVYDFIRQCFHVFKNSYLA